MKDGWKSTEFWFDLAAVVIVYVVGSGVLEIGGTWEKCFTIAATILAALGYTASRTLVKRKDLDLKAMELAVYDPGEEDIELSLTEILEDILKRLAKMEKKKPVLNIEKKKKKKKTKAA